MWFWKFTCPAKIFTCPANICTRPVKLLYTAGKISTCPDWKITCPVGYVTTKVFVPWDKIYMSRACGHALMWSPDPLIYPQPTPCKFHENVRPYHGTHLHENIMNQSRSFSKHTTWSRHTVKCHYNACHYNANASLTRSSLGSQTAPTCPHDHPRVAQHMGYRCEIIAVWSATAAMTPLCSHTNGIKQRYPTCWLCQYSRSMIDIRSNTLIIHLRCSENAINRPIWLLDARMLKTISVAIKLT